MGGDAVATRQGQAAETRQQLLSAARLVFAQQGYRGATVALITEAAGTAHGTFYLHFKNREDVFIEIIGDVTMEIYQHSLLPLAESADERLRHPIRERIAAFLTACQANADLWRALLEAIVVSPRVQEAWAAERAQLHATVAELLTYLQERGAAREMDVRITAAALCSMLEWYAFTGVGFSGDPADLDSSEVAIDTLNQIWQRAIFPQADPRLSASSSVQG